MMFSSPCEEVKWKQILDHKELLIHQGEERVGIEKYLNRITSFLVLGVANMESKNKKPKKEKNLLQEKFVKVRKQINQETLKNFDFILDLYLMKKNLEHVTFQDIQKRLSDQYGEPVTGFLLESIINSKGLLQQIETMDKSHQKELLNIHEKYNLLLNESRVIYESPNRWKFVNTQLMQSSLRGMFFSTRIMKYNKEEFIFDSLPDDYFLFIKHLTKNIKDISTNSIPLFEKAIDSIIDSLQSVKKDVINRSKKRGK